MHTLTDSVAPSYPFDARRVLVIDDSAVARAVIARVVDSSDRWAVSRAVPTIATALAFLATAEVEFILLDINLPVIDGLTGMPDLRAAAPTAKIVVVSSAAAGIEALALGAVEVIAKPDGGAYGSHFSRSLLATLDRLDSGDDAPVEAPGAGSPVASCRQSPRSVASIAPVQLPSHANEAPAFDIVAIGASTGGIHALSGVLRELPANCRTPILITQHLPATFMPYFAAQLALLAGRPCDVAVDRMRIRPGRLIVAPGDSHMGAVALGDGSFAIRLSQAPAQSGCLPSVDPMLASLAGVAGDRLLGIVLSGMGRDGVDGARAVKASGGCMIVQDSASSVIWGMPGAVVAASAADAVMSPEAIGRVIAASRRPRQ